MAAKLRLFLLLAAVVSASSAVSAEAAKAAAIPGQYIVVLNAGADERVAEASARAKGATVLQRYRHALHGYAARMSTAQLAEVKTDPRVSFVEDDRSFSFAAKKPPPPPPSQPAQTVPTGIDRIDAELSSTASGSGSGSVNVNVAVLDSGVDTAHPDLNVVGGKSCGIGQGFSDVQGHGTMVAGTIAARDNAIGTVGVVPGARIWSVLVGGKAAISASALLCGIEFVTASRLDGDSTNDIAVANMSLSGPGEDDGNCGFSKKDAVHQAICNSVAAGVTYVVAGGNDARDFRVEVPAAYNEVLTVTAVADTDGKPGAFGPSTEDCLLSGGDGDDRHARFSNFAGLPSDQPHTIAAPGVCILSTARGGGYASDSGTSFSSPHAAGSVALCIAVGRCTGSPAQIISRVVADAAAYNNANHFYGFSGDPIQPIFGRYYGYLIRAGVY